MLTLHLFHGRRSVEEKLSDWGVDGPRLGPLRSVSATYCDELRLETTDGVVVELSVAQGLIYYCGVLYGEFEISNEDEATEQVSALKAEIDGPAFRQAMGVWLKQRVRVSKRFAAIASVFLDAVRECEGDTVADALRVHLTTSWVDQGTDSRDASGARPRLVPSGRGHEGADLRGNATPRATGRLRARANKRRRSSRR
jgi:hypothetical protein